MRRWPLFVIVPIVAFGMPVLLDRSPQDVVLANGARIEWDTCWFEVRSREPAHCGRFYPAPASGAGVGTAISIPVVVLKNSAEPGQRSPILYLEGGPGYPAGLDADTIAFWRTWLKSNGWDHDLVLFDPRGTGLSRPAVGCPEFLSLARRILAEPMTPEQEYPLWAQATRDCYDALKAAGIDPSAYTTTAMTRDVGDMMAALGGTNWNLYGVSYGTRLALSVVRSYPDRIRSVVLDSSYPPEVDSLLTGPYVLSNALTTLLRGCLSDRGCGEVFPDLETDLHAALSALSESPVELSVPFGASGQWIKMAVNDHRFVWILFQALYRWDLVEKIPAAIKAVRHGDYDPLQIMAAAYVESYLDPLFSDAVNMSVECHDLDPAVDRDRYLAELKKFTRASKYVAKAWDQNLCDVWDVGHAADAFREPVVSDIPALFLAGEYDPVTPPAWSERAASRFSNALQVTFPGIGHGVVDSHECAAKVVRAFLIDPGKTEQVACLSALTGPEFSPRGS